MAAATTRTAMVNARLLRVAITSVCTAMNVTPIIWSTSTANSLRHCSSVAVARSARCNTGK